MEKKYAFIFAFIITILIAINFFLFKTQFSPQKEIVKISLVIDGDTLELEDGRRVRLANINAPEKKTHNYELAINYLNKFQNQSLELEIIGIEKYGRILARIYTPDYVNLELVKQGFASKFLVEESELKEFANAEERAINAGNGIWKKSNFANCLESKIDKIKEEITIANQCHKLNIYSWILKDESTKYYKFKEIEIEKITLHTSIGRDNATDIFWNSKTNIWNNDRDSLYIFDKEGNLVHYKSYGY